MQLPIFKTTGEILEYCWAHRARIALYGAVPLAITVILNLAAWLSGTDLMNPQNPVVAGLSIISAIVFLPFTVTWYRAIILGDEDLQNRPLFKLGGLEGQMLIWQLIIGLIVIGIAVLGALVISAVLGALTTVLGPATQLLSAAALGMWGIFVISMLCRLSLVLAMVATGRPAVMREAWSKSERLGTRMAAIFVLCVLSIIALLIPAQFIVVTAASIVGILAESAAETVSMVLQILLGALASLLIYVLPATLFAFVYTRIAAAMAASHSNFSEARLESASGQGYASTVSHADDLTPDRHQHANTDEEVTSVLERLGRYMADKPKETAADMRALIDGLFSDMALPAGVTSEDVDVDGIPGCWITASDADPNKVILLLHGGGFVSGSIAAYRRLAADVSAFCSTRVLLIEYRLAPEHPYPAGLDDSVRAYSWLLETGFKPGHIALLGDSAGGGLVVSTAMRLKDAGVDLPSALIALSPWVNLACDGETMDTKAKDDPITSRDALANIASLYLGDGDPKDPLMSPIYGDLRGLPPLLIQVGTREVLLDDSRKLAVRARADDVPVTLEEWPGMFHVWHMWTESLTDAGRALGGIGAFVRRHMG